MTVTHRAKCFRGLRQVGNLGRKIQHTVPLDIFRKENGVFHVRMENRLLLPKEMNYLDGIAALPEQMAQVEVRADFLAHCLAKLHQRAWVVDNEIRMHLQRNAMYAV